jgi:transcriptional regulator with XRE-family HTH domain
VKFPNIAYAADVRGLAQYQLALNARMSKYRLSRCMNGRSEFSSDERERISVALGFDESWLFERPNPPRPRACESEATHAVALRDELRESQKDSQKEVKQLFSEDAEKPFGVAFARACAQSKADLAARQLHDARAQLKDNPGCIKRPGASKL